MPNQETHFVRLDYPLDHVKDPILYHLVVDHHLVPNLQRAKIDVHSGGMMVLRLEGTPEDLAAGKEFLRNAGVTLTELDGDA